MTNKWLYRSADADDDTSKLLDSFTERLPWAQRLKNKTKPQEPLSVSEESDYDFDTEQGVGEPKKDLKRTVEPIAPDLVNKILNTPINKWFEEGLADYYSIIDNLKKNISWYEIKPLATLQTNQASDQLLEIDNLSLNQIIDELSQIIKYLLSLLMNEPYKEILSVRSNVRTLFSHIQTVLDYSEKPPLSVVKELKEQFETYNNFVKRVRGKYRLYNKYVRVLSSLLVDLLDVHVPVNIRITEPPKDAFFFISDDEDNEVDQKIIKVLSEYFPEYKQELTSQSPQSITDKNISPTPQQDVVIKRPPSMENILNDIVAALSRLPNKLMEKSISQLQLSVKINHPENTVEYYVNEFITNIQNYLDISSKIVELIDYANEAQQSLHTVVYNKLLVVDDKFANQLNQESQIQTLTHNIETVVHAAELFIKIIMYSKLFIAITQSPQIDANTNKIAALSKILKNFLTSDDTTKWAFYYEVILATIKKHKEVTKIIPAEKWNEIETKLTDFLSRFHTYKQENIKHDEDVDTSEIDLERRLMESIKIIKPELEKIKKTIIKIRKSFSANASTSSAGTFYTLFKSIYAVISGMILNNKTFRENLFSNVNLVINDVDQLIITISKSKLESINKTIDTCIEDLNTIYLDLSNWWEMVSPLGWINDIEKILRDMYTELYQKYIEVNYYSGPTHRLYPLEEEIFLRSSESPEEQKFKKLYVKIANYLLQFRRSIMKVINLFTKLMEDIQEGREIAIIWKELVTTIQETENAPMVERRRKVIPILKTICTKNFTFFTGVSGPESIQQLLDLFDKELQKLETINLNEIIKFIYDKLPPQAKSLTIRRESDINTNESSLISALKKYLETKDFSIVLNAITSWGDAYFVFEQLANGRIDIAPEFSEEWELFSQWIQKTALQVLTFPVTDFKTNVPKMHSIVSCVFNNNVQEIQSYYLTLLSNSVNKISQLTREQQESFIYNLKVFWSGYVNKTSSFVEFESFIRSLFKEILTVDFDNKIHEDQDPTSKLKKEPGFLPEVINNIAHCIVHSNYVLSTNKPFQSEVEHVLHYNVSVRNVPILRTFIKCFLNRYTEYTNLTTEDIKYFAKLIISKLKTYIQEGVYEDCAHDLYADFESEDSIEPVGSELHNVPKHQNITHFETYITNLIHKIINTCVLPTVDTNIEDNDFYDKKLYLEWCLKHPDVIVKGIQMGLARSHKRHFSGGGASSWVLFSNKNIPMKSFKKLLTWGDNNLQVLIARKKYPLRTVIPELSQNEAIYQFVSEILYHLDQTLCMRMEMRQRLLADQLVYGELKGISLESIIRDYLSQRMKELNDQMVENPDIVSESNPNTSSIQF